MIFPVKCGLRDQATASKMKPGQLKYEREKRGCSTRIPDAQLLAGFEKRNVKVAAISVDGFEMEYKPATYSKYTEVPGAAQAAMPVCAN